jgi:hypothetical protein
MSTPSGWYDDPTDPLTYRFWDGAAWTSHQSPKTVLGTFPPPSALHVASAPQRTETRRDPTPRRRFLQVPMWVWAVGGLLVVAGAAGGATRRSNTKPTQVQPAVLGASETVPNTRPSTSALQSTTLVTTTNVALDASTARPTTAVPSTSVAVEPSSTPSTVPIIVAATEQATTSPPRPIAATISTTAPIATAYYANCTAVRNAGKAPLHRGDPGYSAALDRDNDGVACE